MAQHSMYRDAPAFGIIGVVALALIAVGCAPSPRMLSPDRSSPARHVKARPTHAVKPPKPTPKSTQPSTPAQSRPDANEPQSPTQVPTQTVLIDETDFALAFADTSEPADAVVARPQPTQPEPTIPAPRPTATSSPRAAAPSRDMTVPDTRVRIAVKRNVVRAALYTVGEVAISGISSVETAAYRGRIVAEVSARTDRAVLRMGPLKLIWVALPCTLLSRDNGNFFELDDASYRGSFIVCSEKSQKITIVNYLDVEDYLRGVVPLEIGKRPPEEVEAVKAQAVAARTYSYRRAMLKSDQPFDMVATVEDQVYGGVSAEARESDEAIRTTRGLVLVYSDSLINAYYHSTCGGRTASIQDVWGKPPASYLTSVSDAAPNGQPYCAISSYCTWTEVWSTSALSSLISRYAASAGFNCPDRTSVRDLTVQSRYECGRVKSLAIQTSSGSCEVGGDKVRFVLRREAAGSPILRSASFSVISVDSRQVSIEGRGYGHGVGMCQMGAVGRAQSGYTFGQILGAYYPGAEIVRVVADR